MRPVTQLIVDKKDGDCTRACLCSILELDADKDNVPNFITYGINWFQMFWDFLRDSDYEYYGVGFPKGDEYPQGHTLNETPNIDGYVIASVPSKTFEEVGHSVVMNLEGIVVHDPNPNRLWQDINVVESGELQHWMMIGSKGIEI